MGYRLICGHQAGGRVQLPTGVVVAFDIDGVSDEIDADSAKAACQVPGYSLFETPDTVAGVTSGIVEDGGGSNAEKDPAAEDEKPRRRAKSPAAQ